MWTGIFIALFVLTCAGLVFLYMKDRRYLHKPTRDALSPELKKEIEEERTHYHERQERFERALKKAGKKSEQVSKGE